LDPSALETGDQAPVKPVHFDASRVDNVEEGFLEGPNKERVSEQLRQQYESTVLLLEQEKAREQRRQEIASQGAAFSKEFLRLRLTAQDFKQHFEVLLEKYPLAHEDPFSQRLIERGMRIAGSAPKPEPAPVELPPVLEVGAAPEQGLRIDLDSHDEYQHLRDRLRALPTTGAPDEESDALAPPGN
jgi:hypothetical protein